MRDENRKHSFLSRKKSKPALTWFASRETHNPHTDWREKGGLEKSFANIWWKSSVLTSLKSHPERLCTSTEQTKGMHNARAQYSPRYWLQIMLSYFLRSTLVEYEENGIDSVGRRWWRKTRQSPTARKRKTENGGCGACQSRTLTTSVSKIL